MLACARIGAIHSVWCSAASPATVARDAHRRRPQPKVIVSADAGMRSAGGAVQTAARRGHQARSREAAQGAAGRPRPDKRWKTAGRDVDYKGEAARAAPEYASCPRVGGFHASATSLYTSGTTGKAKGVQRDTGGTRWRWPRRCGTSTANARRNLFHHQRHRLGGRATATSSTARCWPGMATIMYEACRRARTPASGGRPRRWRRQGHGDVQRPPRRAC